MERQFRGKKKPSKHRFKPYEQPRRTSLQAIQEKLASLKCQSLCSLFIITITTSVKPVNFINSRVTGKDLHLLLVSLAKRYACAARRALFHPEIASE